MQFHKSRLAYAFAAGLMLAAPMAHADIVGFTANDRDTLAGYVRTLPATETKAQGKYRVGEIIPVSDGMEALPNTIASRISPAPDGYAYVQAGSDVYLINNQRQIVDRVGTR